jgi:long-chain acyl-CoA synthetase
VQPQGGAALEREAIRAFLRERIADYKVPRVIEFAAELPREESGKIFKRKLREPFWAGLDRRI